ncbi:MAG: CPBP family intramembrane glutamic endopeptidase [Candidatus Sericytochromatia bacterium]|nr:CPBP family intramembrane glutamic endopeptidase [Candidatus Sericytochromatia bacterium]
MVPEPLTVRTQSGLASLTWLLGKLVLVVGVAVGLKVVWPGFDKDPLRLELPELVLLAAALGLVADHWVRVEGRHLADLGYPPGLRGLLPGLGAGLGGVVLTTGVGWWAGWSIPRPGFTWPEPSGLVMLGLLALATAVLEETFFRGIVPGILGRTMTWPRTTIASATLFAATHFLAPAGRSVPDIVSTFAGLWATGITLGVAARKRGLWFPVGVHACWIVAITASARYNPMVFLPEGFLWTGNGFPPRGLLGILAMVILLALLGRSRSSGGQVAAG